MGPDKTSAGPASGPGNEYGLFDGGPPLRLLRLWGRFDPQHRHVVRRAIVVVCVGWLPLLALALVALAVGNVDVWQAFLRDASVHARSLIVAPLFVLAEAICIPRLGALAHTFRERGIVPSSQAPAYEKIVRSIRRLRDGWPVEALAVVLAYVIALLLIQHVPASFLPDWHRSPTGAPLGRSLASWWHALVSLPILLVLLLGWCWRVFLWARYLWLVSRLELRLVAAHPEGAAGLMFVSYSLPSFSILGVAIGVTVAAMEMAHLLTGGTVSLEQLGRAAFGTVVGVVIVFTAPLLVFSGPLLRTWHRAVATYGALAQRVGEEFEDKWMHGNQGEETSEPLSSADFSAVADLFQSVDKAHTLRLVPVELRSVIALGAASALPFGLVALTLVPFDEVLGKLVGALL
ncbi:hypothetical protein [Variovorax sp. YR216]|uniref:hypothetical protein n=1 Tax=Variovorax sp. YR216 TaxID=1882828 RepID=UPI00089C3F92|nr:hypothetical protein [Variovorax sp. YR216]SEA38986.1 hypothetical protein SAMN05444680_102211 [Variovorax sp. YR216]